MMELPHSFAFLSDKVQRPKYNKCIIFCAIGVFLAFLLLASYQATALILPSVFSIAKSFPSPSLSNSATNTPESDLGDSKTCASRFQIPNTVHFVYILADASPSANLSLDFTSFLSIYAVSNRWNPDKIYLHTNAHADTLTRARAGQTGKWTAHILAIPKLEINAVEMPTHAGNGRELNCMEHKSDFVRVEAVRQFGGVYIDWDVHALRDIAVLRDSGFAAISGRQPGGELNSGTFMSVKEGRLITLWRDGMNRVYDGGWTTHSNGQLTRFAQRLVREPGEMLILDQAAFVPETWAPEGLNRMFQEHGEARNLTQASIVDVPNEGFADRWDKPGDFEDWMLDWSSSYLLHAFKPGRFVADENKVTPKMVFGRRSNFARAVFPIAKMALDRGLINIEDTAVG